MLLKGQLKIQGVMRERSKYSETNKKKINQTICTARISEIKYIIPPEYVHHFINRNTVFILY